MHQYIPYLCIGMNTYLIHPEHIIYMCIYICVCIYIYIYVYVCIYVCICMYVYVYVHKNKLDKIAKTVDGILT